MNFKFLLKLATADHRIMQALNDNAGGGSVVGTANPFTFNGKAVDFTYNDNLSARLNRKLLKKKLKEIGGDKADATGLISEYWSLRGGASDTDKKWLEARSKLYGYTTDANGNRDYHRTGNPVGRTFATIAGGLVMGPTGAYIANLLAKKNTPAGLVKGFYNPSTAAVEKPGAETPTADVPKVPEVKEDQVASVKPTSYSFSGFSGPWGSRILNVYNNNQLNEHWGKMDADQDGLITLNEFSAYLGLLGETADGKLGRNTLNALGLSSQLSNYNWMKPINPNPVNPNPTYTPTLNDMWVDNTKSFGFNGTVNGAQGTGGYVNIADWEKARTDWYNDWESRVSDLQKAKWNAKFGEGNYTVRFDPSTNNYIASVSNKLDMPGNINRRYNHNTRTMGWYNGSQPIQGIINALGQRIQFNEYGIANNGRGLYKIDDNGLILYRTQLGNWRAADEGTTVFRNGGLLKFQQGGQLDDQDKMLLASTLGMIGYAASQGKLMLVEEAAAQVVALAQSQPEALLELASNKEFINAGIQAVGLETVQKLSQPGVMKQLLSQVNKMPKAMKGTKLNYIKELKGICPEGYELLYFAAGGQMCSRCAKMREKIDEAKCGKKMKKKQDGGDLTEKKGGISKNANMITADVFEKIKNAKNVKQDPSDSLTPVYSTPRADQSRTNRRELLKSRRTNNVKNSTEK